MKECCGTAIDMVEKGGGEKQKRPKRKQAVVVVPTANADL